MVFGALFFDLLEPAKILSLTTQKEDIDLIKVVESIGSTQRRYTGLLDRITKDPEAIFGFPRLKSLVSQIKSSNFFNSPLSDVTTHKYQDTVLLYFTLAKEKLRKAASKILQSICQCFHQIYGELTTNETKDTYVQETVTQGDDLLYHICRILNTNSWIIPEGLKTSAAVKKFCISIQRIHSHYKEMEIIKDQLIDELLEQYVQVIECANQYYEVSLFEPLKMWSMLHKKISLRFPDIFHFVELCLCAPHSNAMVECFFNYLKIVKTDWRSRLNERNIESLLRIKVEGPDLKEFAKKMCANAVTLWWE